jgi:DNA-directed RNA polymerase
MTVSRLAEKGLNDFAMIHDSYGVHACDTETLNTVLRECALDIYSTDVLGDFHAYAQSQTSVVLPTPPELGEYDINEITNAPYFFS